MRYQFHVHKHVARWRMVKAEGAPPPPGCTIEDWTHTRTREADDTNRDIRQEVDTRGFALFKLGGDFADVDSDRADLTADPSASAAKALAQFPVHLGLGGTAVSQPEFTGASSWYEAYGERHAADGSEGRLISMFTFTRAWDVWEVHPHGAELVLCTAGEFTLIQEIAGEHVLTTLRRGQYAINAPSVWHTADVTQSATAVFVTAGVGTDHRPR